MIYLIGGPPRCGKTTVARRLAGQLGCSWVQTDYLGATIARYVPEGEWGMLRPAVEALALDNDVRYAMFSPLEVVDHYRGRAELAWPGISAFIAYAQGDEIDLVLEGYHLEPSLIDRLPAAARGGVRSLFLYRTDQDETAAAIRRGSAANDWVLERTAHERTFTRIAAMIVGYSAVFEEAARRRGYPALAMDGAFGPRVEQALALLTDRAG